MSSSIPWAFSSALGRLFRPYRRVMLDGILTGGGGGGGGGSSYGHSDDSRMNLNTQVQEQLVILMSPGLLTTKCMVNRLEQNFWCIVNYF